MLSETHWTPAMRTTLSGQVTTVAVDCNDRDPGYVLCLKSLTADFVADHSRSATVRMRSRYCGDWRYVSRQKRFRGFWPSGQSVGGFSLGKCGPENAVSDAKRL